MYSSLVQKLSRFAAGLVGCLLVVALGGCKPDACESLACDHGVCVDGACNCDAYYEGADCASRSRDKFLGSNWYNSRTCPGVGGILLVSSIQSAGPTEGNIFITNIHQQGDTVTALVTGNAVEIPIQVYGLEYIEGQGVYSDGDITIDYDIVQTGGQRTGCIAHFDH